MQSHRRRIIVFYNESGGAHVSAAKVISEIFPGHEIVLVNFAKEFLNKVNGMAKITRNRVGSDELYNFAMRKGLFGIINFVGKHFAYDLIGRNLTALQRHLKDYFASHPTDLVISTIPLVNSAILPATRSLGLPFILVTLDGDLRYWKIGLRPTQSDRFAITIALNNRNAREELLRAGFPESVIFDSGFPIRQSFLKHYDRDGIRKEFDAPKDASVVMILMGGEGSKRILELIEILSRSDKTLHILACIGKSETLRKEISDITTSQSVTINTIGFTQRIPELMAMSDLLITKSGPSTIIEALQLKLPMIIDQRGAVLDQESKHADFVLSNNLGLVLRHGDELLGLVDTIITDNDASRLMKSSFDTLRPLSFQVTFPKIVDGLMAPPPALEVPLRHK